MFEGEFLWFLREYTPVFTEAVTKPALQWKHRLWTNYYLEPLPKTFNKTISSLPEGNQMCSADMNDISIAYAQHHLHEAVSPTAETSPYIT